MKEGISNIWLIGIIMVFISVFASYIAITINYTDSFKIKNEALKIVEKHKGMTDKVATTCSDCAIVNPHTTIHVDAGALQTINLYLKGRAYTSMGHCPNDGKAWYGVPELSWDSQGNYEPANNDTKYYWCFSRYGVDRLTGYDTEYYKLRFFYKLEFPALSEWLAIKVEGLTDEIYDPAPVNFTKNGSIYS